MRHVLYSAIAGAVLVLAYPPYGWAVFAPAAVGGFLFTVRTVTGRTQAGLSGLAFGGAFFGLLFPWIGELGVVALIPLVLVQAAFPALYGMAMYSQRRLSARSWWAVATGGWAAMELLRLRVPFGGFGWGLVGYPAGELGLTRDATQFIGTTGWSVLIVGLAAGGIVWFRNEERTPVVWVVIAIAGLILMGLLASPSSDGPEVRVAIVQGSTPCPEQRCAGERQMTYETSLQLTRSIEPGTVDLVVWPEGSSGFAVDPVLDPGVAEQMGDEAERLGAVLLAGGDRPLTDTSWTNANVVFASTGEIVGEYAKRHPVPFGEYVPLRPLFGWIPDLSRVPRDMIRGPGPVVFDEGFGPFGSVISFESSFSRYSRDTINAGAQLLVVATSQASYPFSDASAQLIGMTRMRSAELGVDVVHSAITGSSTFITDGGEIGEVTELVAATVIVDTMQLRDSGRTLYAVLGDWVALLASVGALVVAIGGRKPLTARG